MSARAARGIAAAAGTIAVITLLARTVGLVRVGVFAEAVRAGGVGEIYQAVNALPNVLVEVSAGGILAAVAIPLIAGHLGAGDPARAHSLANTLLTYTLAVLVPAAGLLALAAPWLALALIDDFDPRAHGVATTMIRAFALQVPLYGLGIVLTGLLHAHQRFVAAALAPLLSSCVVIGVYLTYGALVGGSTAPTAVSDAAVSLLAWGTTAGVVALSVPLVVPALRTGWRPGIEWRLPSADTAAVRRLAGAGLLVVGSQQGALVGAIWLAGRSVDRGVLPVWQYAQTVMLLPYAVLAVPIATATFPALAVASGSGGPDPRTLARSLRSALLVSGLGASVMLATARPVGALFTLLDSRRGAGASAEESLAALPATLILLAPALIGWSVIALLLRALYVHGPALPAAAAVAVGWGVALTPVVTTGAGADADTVLKALAVAMSMGLAVAALGLGVLVRRSWGAESVAGAGRSLGAIIVGVALSLAVADLVVAGWRPTTLVGVIGWGSAAALVAAVAFISAVALADRDLVRSLRERGRARRQGSA